MKNAERLNAIRQNRQKAAHDLIANSLSTLAVRDEGLRSFYAAFVTAPDQASEYEALAEAVAKLVELNGGLRV